MRGFDKVRGLDIVDKKRGVIQGEGQLDKVRGLDKVRVN